MESAEEINPNEFQQKAPAQLTYTEKVPIEFFDFIVIDECHAAFTTCGNRYSIILMYFK
jgi:type I restriction enzyme R subunit